MRIVRILAIGLLAAGAACSRDNAGVIVTPDPVGGLRYVNLVSDTGAMDFRVIDIIGDAPNTIAATFRTGGLVFGNVNPSPTQPPYQPVRAGARHIRVFMSGTTAAVASTQMFDTTVTFAANTNYTFFLFGTSRTGVAGRCCSVLITKDSVPTLAAGKWAVRVLNLAPDYAGAPTVPAAGSGLDLRIASTAGATPTAAASTATVGVITNQALGNLSSYVSLDTSGTAVTSVPGYKLFAVANGTTSPAVFQAVMPLGTRGSATSNPFAGTSVAGTAITAVILPRSTPASLAPQTAAASVTTNIDSLTRSSDTVTVWRRITPGNGTTTCNAAVAAGTAVNDIVNVSGLTQTQYNGMQSVISVTAGVSQTLDTARQTVTLAAGTAGSTFRLTFSGQQTGAIAFDETAVIVQAALGALTSIGGIANVNVTGPAGGPYVVVFRGTFLGSNPVPAMTITTAGTVTGTVATNFNCLGTATSSRFRFRISGTPVSPATGVPAYKVLTNTNDFTAPSAIFLFDRQPARTAP